MEPTFLASVSASTPALRWALRAAPILRDLLGDCISAIIFKRHFVGGAEIDSMFGSIRAGGLGLGEFNQNFLSSMRAKAGYAFGDILGYGTIGWAYSTANYEDPSGSQSKTIGGSVFGFGAEYALTRNVSIRAEYLRYDFGNATYSTPYSSKQIYTDTNLLRVGGSVHF
jgi:outer membrane immunogenic protein